MRGPINLPTVEDHRLSLGKRGNIETVDFMRKVAHERAGHPLVRRLALAIIQNTNIKSHFYLNEALAIGEFVQRKVRYVKDPVGIEQLHDPITLIEQIERGVSAGDCDDMALLTATLLLSVGIQPYFRMVRYKSLTGPYNHIYVVVYETNGREKRKRVALDAIIKDRPMGFEVPQRSGDEVKV